MTDPRPDGTSVTQATKSPWRRWSRRLMLTSAILGLLGITVSVIHFIWPTPLMFALFWAVGQTSFGLAMILYVAVIFMDLKRLKVL